VAELQGGPGGPRHTLRPSPPRTTPVSSGPAGQPTKEARNWQSGAVGHSSMASRPAARRRSSSAAAASPPPAPRPASHRAFSSISCRLPRPRVSTASRLAPSPARVSKIQNTAWPARCCSRAPAVGRWQPALDPAERPTWMWVSGCAASC
jgi:hypothetical protein